MPIKRISQLTAIIFVAGLCLAVMQHRDGASRSFDATCIDCGTRPSSAERQGARSLVTHSGMQEIQLCQMITPATPCPVPGVDCACEGCQGSSWKALGPSQFQLYGPGEYVARPRIEHVPQYRLRVDDELDVVFRLTRDISPKPYELGPGDEVRIETATDKDDHLLNRTVIVQPDGTITMPLLGQVRAAGQTVTQLRDTLDERYKTEKKPDGENGANGNKPGDRAKFYYREPALTVTPLRVNTKLEDIRATVDSRAGFGGQFRRAKVTPEGSIALPAIGSAPAQGLTLEELKSELDARYAEIVDGLEVTPILVQRAPRYVFVLGEVRLPARYELQGPTTVMQAIAMAGSWNVGANIRQVVVFRRAEDWRLIATVVDVRQALLGRQPCPAGEIWVADNDLIIVPKSDILLFTNFVDLVFTKGVYGIMPFSTNLSYTNLTTLAP